MNETKTLTLREFQPLAIRTLADTGSKILDSIHMTLGIVSESQKELTQALQREDSTNTAEELGDIQWYAVAYLHIHGISIDFEQLVKTAFDMPRDIVIEKFLFALGHLSELDKNELVYGKIVSSHDEGRVEAIWDVLVYTEAAGVHLEIDMESVRYKIIEKLKARFPEKFSKEAAINRNTEVEREILES